jgi:tRNA pseudouridine38-40 synthase
MRNIRMTLQYDGTDFQGWQSQAQGERTVQDVLETAIMNITGEEVRISAAGRTDTGVHALEQVVSFPTASKLGGDTLARALNAVLPPDVRVLECRDVPEDFHPRYGARSKRYVYIVANMEVLSPFVSRYAWHMRRPLDVEAMRSAVLHLTGEHDFRAFMAAGSSVKTTVRELTELRLTEEGSIGFLGFTLEGRFLRLEAEGNGFLRHMVRNIAGTMVEVGKGRMAPEYVREILVSGDRDLAGPTAPARGLFLERITY